MRVIPRVRRYRDGDAAAWDAFVASSATGTFLHSRRFLAYHGARFDDRSLVFEGEDGRLQAVLPAAVDPADPHCVASHPGATYGGLLLPPERAADTFAMLEAAAAHWRTEGFARLSYRCVPPPLHVHSSQMDGYALWRAGATLVRRDLWSIVDLDRRPRVAAERLRHLRRAAESGMRVVRDDGSRLPEFHALLATCLRDRHETAPVHSLDDMIALQRAFPDRIALWLACDARDDVLAGEWIFDVGDAWHGQYGAATESGRRVSAQDRLLETILGAAATAGRRRFSFGTSTTRQGRELNAGLFRYKASFGAGTVVQDFFELPLDRTEA